MTDDDTQPNKVKPKVEEKWTVRANDAFETLIQYFGMAYFVVLITCVFFLGQSVERVDVHVAAASAMAGIRIALKQVKK